MDSQLAEHRLLGISILKAVELSGVSLGRLNEWIDQGRIRAQMRPVFAPFDVTDNVNGYLQITVIGEELFVTIRDLLNSLDDVARQRFLHQFREYGWSERELLVHE